jgi:hypothetical protein
MAVDWYIDLIIRVMGGFLLITCAWLLWSLLKEWASEGFGPVHPGPATEVQPALRTKPPQRRIGATPRMEAVPLEPPSTNPIAASGDVRAEHLLFMRRTLNGGD